MRKITKKFCGNNAVLLSYFRESRRYSPTDIRIRKATIGILNATRSIPLYIQNFRLAHIQNWIEDNITITILHEIPSQKKRKIQSAIFLYQI